MSVSLRFIRGGVSFARSSSPSTVTTVVPATAVPTVANQMKTDEHHEDQYPQPVLHQPVHDLLPRYVK